MSKDNLRKIAEEIKTKNPPSNFPIKLIAIDGRGGAGKSFLAERLSKELKAGILHTDDFASYDNPMDWWPSLIEKVFEPIRAGVKTLNYKRSSWYKNHNPKPVINKPVTPIMILEGVGSSRREFRPYLTYAIWVETPKEVCLARGIKRDLEDSEGVKTHKEIVADWEKWHKYEDEYINRDDPRAYANVGMSGAADDKNS